MSLAKVHRQDPLLETGEVADNVDSMHANSLYKDQLAVLIHTRVLLLKGEERFLGSLGQV
jgi:hypothetical protein